METKELKNTVEMSEAEELTLTEVEKSQKKAEKAHKPEVDVELERRKKFIYYEEMEMKALAVFKFLASHGLVYGFLAQFSSNPGPGTLFIMFYLVMVASISITDSAIFHMGIGMYAELDSRSNFRYFGSLLCIVALLSIFSGKMEYMIWFGLIGSCMVYIGELLIVLKFFKIMHRVNGQH